MAETKSSFLPFFFVSPLNFLLSHTPFLAKPLPRRVKLANISARTLLVPVLRYVLHVTIYEVTGSSSGVEVGRGEETEKKKSFLFPVCLGFHSSFVLLARNSSEKKPA